MGNGIYYENTGSGTSILTFNSATVNSLTTIGGAGKKVAVTYWQ
jgi:hypothetical protein